MGLDAIMEFLRSRIPENRIFNYLTKRKDRLQVRQKHDAILRHGIAVGVGQGDMLCADCHVTTGSKRASQDRRTSAFSSAQGSGLTE